jgi:hypothetical protein
MPPTEKIQDLVERIQDFERAISRFENTSGRDDPMVQTFQHRLDSMRAELAQITHAAESA